jgi:hypothetical protein
MHLLCRARLCARTVTAMRRSNQSNVRHLALVRRTRGEHRCLSDWFTPSAVHVPPSNFWQTTCCQAAKTARQQRSRHKPRTRPCTCPYRPADAANEEAHTPTKRPDCPSSGLRRTRPKSARYTVKPPSKARDPIATRYTTPLSRLRPCPCVLARINQRLHKRRLSAVFF